MKYALNQGLKTDECATRRVLGAVLARRTCSQKGNLERTEAYLSESLDISRELDNRYEMGQTTFQIGLLQYKQGKPDHARASLYQAQAIFEELEASLDLAEVKTIGEHVRMDDVSKATT